MRAEPCSHSISHPIIDRISCPLGFTTVGDVSTNEAECIITCEPGTYAELSAGPCEPCGYGAICAGGPQLTPVVETCPDAYPFTNTTLGSSYADCVGCGPGTALLNGTVRFGLRESERVWGEGEERRAVCSCWSECEREEKKGTLSPLVLSRPHRPLPLPRAHSCSSFQCIVICVPGYYSNTTINDQCDECPVRFEGKTERESGHHARARARGFNPGARPSLSLSIIFTPARAAPSPSPGDPGRVSDRRRFCTHQPSRARLTRHPPRPDPTLPTRSPSPHSQIGSFCPGGFQLTPGLFPCGAGLTTVQTASQDNTTCVANCAPGTYSPNSDLPCLQCGAGQFCEGGPQPDPVIQACPPPSFTVSTTSTSLADCKTCSVGVPPTCTVTSCAPGAFFCFHLVHR